MSDSRSFTLLTGATGLIGRYLMRDLLTAGEQLAVLARPSKKESAEVRIDAIMQSWDEQLGRKLPRPKVLVGEVTEPGLGLCDADRNWAKSNCGKLLHNAALLEFYGSDRTAEPWRTNLTGTTLMLECCKDIGIRDLHYVSTAYVSGDRPGPIMEDELRCGQGFRNDYEASKFEAECAVRDADFLDQLTVYRPAVVAGDSVTGYTSTYHGLYLYLKLIAMMIRQREPDADGVRRYHARWNCTGDEFRNIIPVDWVSAAMTRLFTTPAAHGGTYQLAPVNPITLRQLVDYIGTFYNSTGIEFCGTEGLKDEELTDFERDGYASIAIYQSYLTTDPRFDMTNLNKFAADMPCPDIDEAMMHRFIQYGEDDLWGKRRVKRVAISDRDEELNNE